MDYALFGVVSNECDNIGISAYNRAWRAETTIPEYDTNYKVYRESS